MLPLKMISNWLFPLSSWVSNGVVGSPAFAAYDQGLHFICNCVRLALESTVVV